MPRDREFLLDILIAARLAIQYVAGKTLEDFTNDTQCQDAVIRRLVIIGEAAGRISQQTMVDFHQLPWQSMIAMRNVMVHKYDDIDLYIVWDTLHQNVKQLIIELEKLNLESR